MTINGFEMQSKNGKSVQFKSIPIIVADRVNPNNTLYSKEAVERAARSFSEVFGEVLRKDRDLYVKEVKEVSKDKVGVTANNPSYSNGTLYVDIAIDKGKFQKEEGKQFETRIRGYSKYRQGNVCCIHKDMVITAVDVCMVKPCEPIIDVVI